MQVPSLVKFGLGVVLAVVGLAVVLYFPAKKKLEASLTSKWKEPAEQFERLAPQYAEAFCADARALTDPSLKAPTHTGEDAALRFNAHVPWDPTPDAGLFDPADPVWVSDGGVEVAEALANWPDGITQEQCGRVDTRWLSALGGFDHWSIVGAGGPLSDAPHTLGWLAPEVPVPDFRGAMAAVKLHLACGLANGRGAEAAREVRHFAKLVLSTETVLACVLQTVFLNDERKAFESARRRGLDTSGWTPVAEADTERLRRLCFGVISLTSTPVDDATFAQVSQCARPLGIDCVGLSEGIAFWDAQARVAAEPWRGRAQRRLAMVSSNSGSCRYEYARYCARRGVGPTTPNAKYAADVSGILMSTTIPLPGLRKRWPAVEGRTPAPDGGVL